MVTSPHALKELFSQAIDQPLSNADIANFFTSIDVIEPAPGQVLWRSSTAKPGLFFVLEGRVRVLDGGENLIHSLEAGSCFGEATLFLDEVFQPYTVRASVNAKLCFMQSEKVEALLKKYPSVRQHLHRQASDRTRSIQTANPTARVEPPVRRIRIHAKKTKRQQISNAYFPTPKVTVRQWWQRTMRSYPMVEQHSASDCGVACLTMVGRYWGKNFNSNQLRSLANVDRDGASLRGLMVAAETIGFSPRPVKASLDQLAKQKLPAIVHWEGNHYIVVYQVARDAVYVCDPAKGRRRLNPTEFKQGWTTYTLLLQPTATLKDTPEAKQLLWKFFALIKPHWRILSEVMLASIVLQLLGIVTPILTQILLDRVVVQRSESTFFAIAIGLLLFSLFRTVVLSIRQYLLYHTSNRVDLALVVGFINHTLKLPLQYFESRFVGDITSRVQENQKIRSFLTSDALTTGLDVLMIFIYLGMMFVYSWQMAMLVICFLPIFALIALVATPFLRKVSREVFASGATEESYLIEALTGIGTIKSIGIEQTVRWRWEELFNQYIKENFSGQMIRERLNLISRLYETIVSTVLLLFGVWQVIHGQLTIGQMFAFNMLVGNVISPFQRLIALWYQFQEVLISVERLNDVIETEPEESGQAALRPMMPPIEGQVKFERVTFSYNAESETNTLDQISFSVEPGQTVAIVGRSGSGKTTISKLLLGLYAPKEGRVIIDGYDLSTISLRSLRQQVGVVDQNTFLFGGTIRENLIVGQPNATMDEIQNAARLAGASLFIDELPQRYETRIGEGGGRLSGGQRQRLAIARALLRKPRLLILDEATSSLDTESERIIQANLNTILKQQTTFVIAHRLSTIRNADLILVLDRGKLIESGTHEHLMAQQGQYFYLHQQQFR